MKSHYIEGTNQQYSIREDGIIIRHYLFNYKANKNIYKEKICKIFDANGHAMVTIMINRKRKSFCITTLLKSYFNYTFCIRCNSKFNVTNIGEYVCKECHKNTQNKFNKKRKENLDNNYLLSTLGLKKDECPKELIELQRITIKTKRLLSSKLNIHINSFQNRL